MPFFGNLLLAHKEADSVQAQRMLGTINVRKFNNFFPFIYYLLSLNDDSTFKKHNNDAYQLDIHQQVLIPQNNSNSCACFLDLYIYIQNREFHTRLFDKRVNISFNFIRMASYWSNIPRKMFYERTGA